MVKTYNVGANGIPEQLQTAVHALGLASLPLKFTRHAMSEAVNDRYGVLPASSFPTTFNWCAGWSLVEAESLDGKLSKFVVRRAADATRSLVILVSGTVKTLWTNLNTDKHATLDKSCFDKP